MNTKVQNILIVGAKSDIARAIAREYARQGQSIHLVARNSVTVEKEVADLKIRGAAEVILWSLDLSKNEEIEKFTEHLEPLPDIAICAVGYLGAQQLTEEDQLEMERVVRSNYLGPAQLFEMLAKRMEELDSGVLVGISSVAGDRGRASNYWYGSAKAGFSTFLSGLRQKYYGTGVKVLTIKPGFVRTAMTKDLDLPALLTTTPEKVAKEIILAVKKNKSVLYTPWFWWSIMKLIQETPEFLFKRKKF